MTTELDDGSFVIFSFASVSLPSKLKYMFHRHVL